MEYVYIDISPSFFEESRKNFYEFGDRMVFKTLDLQKELPPQGFEDASYDLILAGSVLHVTSDLSTTLKRVHKLLRPGGHLLFLEITSLDSACANVGFGTLEGWWFGSEEWRQYTPLATEERWDELLRASGFSGLDLLMRDYRSDICHLTSCMISNALDIPNENENRRKIDVSDVSHSSVEIGFLVDSSSIE
jgi:SAM-dependent methyltransferase